jgi:hypothetical protein
MTTRAKLVKALNPAQRERGAHVCAPDRTCTCSMVSEEPDEWCHAHGWPKCVCGRFVAHPLAYKRAIFAHARAKQEK